MKTSCPRLFEVEAMRDGRLTGAEVARFHAHVGLCPTCAREVRAVEALAAALQAPERAGGLPADSDELSVRRRRTRLLAAFDATLLPAPRQAFARLTPILAATLGTLCILIGLAFAIMHRRSLATAIPAAASNAPDPVRVRADGPAQWSRQVDNQLEKIRLEAGTLAIRVDHARSAPRLLVLLPDGELEDIGTAFTVSVDAGRTSRVTVQEGKVVLHLGGKPALALSAGAIWTPDPAPALASAITSAGPNPPLAPSAGSDATSTAPPRSKTAPGLRTAAAFPPPPSGSAEVTSGPDPAADFRAALAALSAGDQTRAAARFSAFLADHPRDPRAEDAAYLRVIALQRSGDALTTQAAARDYLRRYPHGFRRAEVTPLAE
jgi:TolA-binding protein